MAPQSNDSFINWDEIKQLSWKSANFATVVVLTSTAISLVHNPMNAYMFSKVNKIPFSNIRIWDGLAAYSMTTVARTSYLSGMKKKNVEPNAEGAPSQHNINFFQQDMTPYERSYYFALGELVTVQTSEVLSQIRKLPTDVLKNFVWHSRYNLYKLSVTTVGARFLFGYVNFLSLTLSEPFYAERLSISNPETKHFMAGALSGTTAAVLSFPFSYYRDFRLAKATIVNGQVNVPSILNTFEALYDDAKKSGMKGLVKEQLLPRVARTGSRFALLSGISALCGNEPLRHLFFSEKDNQRSVNETQAKANDAPRPTRGNTR